MLSLLKLIESMKCDISDKIDSKVIVELENKPKSPSKEHTSCITAAPPNDNMRSPSSALDSLLNEYKLSDEVYSRVVTLLDEAFTRGLEDPDKATVKMYPTYVTRLPDGTEKGHILALDLGGTNFRVLLVDISSGERISMKNRCFKISTELMSGTAEMLFDFIAECLHEFVKENGLDSTDRTIPLGFTFSFPCKQLSLTNSKLVKWTKGFTVTGVEGEDLSHLLMDAIIRRQNLNIKCVAILNDTVGCLMSAAFHDKNTRIGLILGTGTNASYMEKTEKIKILSPEDKITEEMIINTEWGSFGEDGALDFLRTEHDLEVDLISLFEKMISGMYQGELIRVLIIHCMNAGLLFPSGTKSTKLSEPDSFDTKFSSIIESEDKTDGNERIVALMSKEFGVEGVTEQDCVALRRICSSVTGRAANLAACGITALLNRIGGQCTVGVDGSLYRFHPHFHSRMIRMINQLVNANIQYKLILSEDGSGKGAAIIAAVSSK